jgi:hypothetical protein
MIETQNKCQFLCHIKSLKINSSSVVYLSVCPSSSIIFIRVLALLWFSFSKFVWTALLIPQINAISIKCYRIDLTSSSIWHIDRVFRLNDFGLSYGLWIKMVVVVFFWWCQLHKSLSGLLLRNLAGAISSKLYRDDQCQV